jgi:transcriptional regulator
MVQARGTVTVIEDVHWLKAQVTQLTDDHESTRADRWRVSDAPPEFVDQQIKGIVGIEIEIRDLRGKWKVSQNRSSADRIGVAEALDAEGKHQMADLVSRHGRP